jgi:hypothetical protein
MPPPALRASILPFAIARRQGQNLGSRPLPREDLELGKGNGENNAVALAQRSVSRPRCWSTERRQDRGSKSAAPTREHATMDT